MVKQALDTVQSMDRLQSVQALCAQKDLIEDRRAVVEERRMENRLEMDCLREHLSTLDSRRANIVRMRYGLDGTSLPMTLQEVGRRFNLTKERVRQIEKETIDQLRLLMTGQKRNRVSIREVPAA
jgi:RNA polymerase sigma factor (sigma-70 family)